MTTEIEKELFKVYGVRAKSEVAQIGESLGFCNTTIKYVYPPITNEKFSILIQFIIDKGWTLDRREDIKISTPKTLIGMYSDLAEHDCLQIKEILEK